MLAVRVDAAAELVVMFQGVAVTPLGANVANPAFDVTPNRYVSAIITDRGVARPPYTESLRAVAEYQEPASNRP